MVSAYLEPQILKNKNMILKVTRLRKGIKSILLIFGINKIRDCFIIQIFLFSVIKDTRDSTVINYFTRGICT